MRKMLIALPILAACASPASAQTGESAAIRLLRAENKLLRAQIKTLKSKLGIGTAANATTQNAVPVKSGSTKTFAIHEDAPAWWRDPAALTFEIRLREILAGTMPAEGPAPWMLRNKFLAGRELEWTVKIVSVTSVGETEAGQKVWAMRQSIDSRRKDIESLKKRIRTTADVSRKATLVQNLVGMQLKFALEEADSRRWKKLLDLKGGTVLHVVYREKQKGKQVHVLNAKLVLPASEAAKLKKYQNDKRVRYPKARGSSGGSVLYGGGSRDVLWPVKIKGKVDSVVYDGMTIHVSVDGTWKHAPGDGLTGVKKISSSKTPRVRVLRPVPTGRPGYLNLRH